ncbi:MAG: integral rane sensor signal transduction histidine kinase [Actinobacteria bacterium]|nr:integral rane sensor signal transduction histidine kinase [Actinomycetota bacterium]
MAQAGTAEGVQGRGLAGHPRAAQAALLVAGLGLGLALELGSWSSYPATWRGVVDLAVGWAFLLTGFLASWRRPANRTGWLLTATGLSWYAGNLRFLGNPVAFALGAWLSELPVAVLAQLVFAFPTGRLESRAERIIVGSIYGAILGLSGLRTLALDPTGQARCGVTGGTRARCTANAALIFHSPAAHTILSTLHDAVLAALSIVVLGMLVRRLAKATPPARRTLAPVLTVGAGVVCLFVGVDVAGASRAAPAVQHALYGAAQVGILALSFAFLAGLLQSRLAQMAVSRLVLELGETPPPGKLQGALAVALGDPSVQLAYWWPDRQAFVDLEGRRVLLSGLPAPLTLTVLKRGEEPIGALVHDRHLDQEPELIEAVGAAASLALDNERLHAQLRAKLEEVEASRTRIVEATDAERRRIERDLHDGAQQRLVTMALELGAVRARATRSANPAVASALEGLGDQLSLALRDLRDLARGIHPAVLTEGGLRPALLSLAERSPVPTHVAGAPSERLPATVEATAYFIVSEALANAAKHARASSVTITVARCNEHLEVSVLDDGVGGADPSRGSGLCGLADRAAAVGGALSVASPPGGGTQVTARIPCD